MWLSSTPGVGFTFFFTTCVPVPHPNTELKLNEAQQQPDIPLERYDRLSILFTHSLRADVPILLVDDNELVQKVSKKLLQSAGFSGVDVAENGEVAVNTVKKKKYKIVLMDVMVPLSRL